MASFFYSENGVITKDDGKNMQKDDSQIEPCPVCAEKGEQVTMIRGLPTGYYWSYRCPECGNLALVERGKEQERITNQGDKS